MKKIILALVLLMFAGGALPLTAQTDQKLSKKEQRKKEKEAKKQARLEAERLQMEKLQQLVRDTAFVFVANRLRGNGGVSFSVNSSVNFLAVHGSHATYQFAFDGIPGWNGVGGATFDGDIVKYEYTFGENNKASNLSMTFRPRGVGGLPYITITFFPNSATANITLDQGGMIILDGQIKSLQEAGIFKGQSIF